jgi:hypothetical protein
MASSRPTWTPPPPLLTEDDLIETWDRYRQSLASLPGTPMQRAATLQGLLATVSRQLEESSRNEISRTLLEYTQATDHPVLRSTMPAAQRPSGDRPAPAPFPQPSPVDLLSGSRSRLGPRLTSKLIVASARAQARRSAR